MYPIPVVRFAGETLRRSERQQRIRYLKSPRCLQGAKEVVLADKTYRYDPAQSLLVSIDFPVAARVVEASPGCPFLMVRIWLDPAVVITYAERPLPVRWCFENQASAEGLFGGIVNGSVRPELLERLRPD
jgi:hypothetical protein